MLRLYDLDFNLLGEIDNYNSLQFNRSWYGCGDVELELSRYTLLNSRPKIYVWDKILETIQDSTKEIIIMLNNNPKYAAIVHTDSGSFDESGKGNEYITLIGKELKYLTHRSITYPSPGSDIYEITDNVETVMKSLISYNQGPAANVNRQLPNFEIETDTGQGDSIYYTSIYQPLDTELEDIATANDVGWWYEFDPENKVITAKFNLGSDKTLDSENPIILKQDDGLSKGEYNHSGLEYYNIIIAKGKPEDDTVTNLIKEYGTATGLQRRELYKEFDVIIKAGENPFENLDSAVSQYLSTVNFELYLSGNTLITAPNKFGIDYDLGDLITLQMFDLTQNVRIINTLEVIEVDKPKSIELTFGKSFPTLPNLIYKELKGIKRIL